MVQKISTILKHTKIEPVQNGSRFFEFEDGKREGRHPVRACALGAILLEHFPNANVHIHGLDKGSVIEKIQEVYPNAEYEDLWSISDTFVDNDGSFDAAYEKAKRLGL